MKKITDEEFKNLPLRGKGTATPVYDEIFNLRTGEHLVVEKSDWHRKDTPGRMCRYIEKRHPQVKYESRRHKDEKSWVVTRMK